MTATAPTRSHGVFDANPSQATRPWPLLLAAAAMIPLSSVLPAHVPEWAALLPLIMGIALVMAALWSSRRRTAICLSLLSLWCVLGLRVGFPMPTLEPAPEAPSCDGNVFGCIIVGWVDAWTSEHAQRERAAAFATAWFNAGTALSGSLAALSLFLLTLPPARHMASTEIPIARVLPRPKSPTDHG